MQTASGTDALKEFEYQGWRVQYDPRGSGVELNASTKRVKISPGLSPEQSAFEIIVEQHRESANRTRYTDKEYTRFSREGYRRHRVAYAIGEAQTLVLAAVDLGELRGTDPWELLKGTDEPWTSHLTKTDDNISFDSGESATKIYYDGYYEDSGLAEDLRYSKGRNALEKKIWNDSNTLKAYDMEWERMKEERRKNCHFFRWLWEGC